MSPRDPQTTASSKIAGMTLITERPHTKYGDDIHVRRDLQVERVSVWEQDNVKLISIEMPGEVCPTSTRTRKPTSYCDQIFQPQQHQPQQAIMEKRLNSG